MDAQLNLNKREVFGKKAKQLFEDGQALGNIFGKGEESIAVYGLGNEVDRVVSQAGKNHPITITLDSGKQVMALVHEVERDYITRRMRHVTFHIVKKGEKVTTEVPVHQVDEAPAVRTGKIIVTLMDHVEVEATPADLPEALEVSIANLVDDGDMVTLHDIVVPKGVEIQADLDQPIAKVEVPRSQIEEAAEAEEADAASVPSDHGSDAKAE